MTAAVPDSVAELLAASLPLWGVSGAVVRDAAGGVEVAAGAVRFSIVRAPANLPFRWLLVSAERRRGVTGVAGLLRAVRTAVDPDFRPLRVRVAALPPSP